MSVGRAADVRLAVESVLEQTPHRPLCDVCLGYMVAARPVVIAGFVTRLARQRPDVVRQVEECVGCQRRKVVTVVRPDASAAC